MSCILSLPLFRPASHGPRRQLVSSSSSQKVVLGCRRLGSSVVVGCRTLGLLGQHRGPRLHLMADRAAGLYQHPHAPSSWMIRATQGPTAHSPPPPLVLCPPRQPPVGRRPAPSTRSCTSGRRRTGLRTGHCCSRHPQAMRLGRRPWPAPCSMWTDVSPSQAQGHCPCHCQFSHPHDRNHIQYKALHKGPMPLGICSCAPRAPPHLVPYLTRS
mmetsp:Transcript_100177/g.173036  ORF Transcript_100177/g.173036 Transcript_100177/m.173036 type:complete len:213 (+) Transcript_100177:327-965(+)